MKCFCLLAVIASNIFSIGLENSLGGSGHQPYTSPFYDVNCTFVRETGAEAQFTERNPETHIIETINKKIYDFQTKHTKTVRVVFRNGDRSILKGTIVTLVHCLDLVVHSSPSREVPKTASYDLYDVAYCN